MKKILLTCLLTGLTTATVIAQQSEVRNLKSFSGVSVGEGIDVFLKKGDAESVRVVVSDASDLSNIITEISGSYLKIHMSSGRHGRGINAKVYVTYTTLGKITASSAASVYSEGTIKSNALTVSTSSAANVELNLDVDKLEVSVSSAGGINLEGKADAAVFDVSSAGKLDAYNLEVESLNVEASSAGSARVNVVKQLVAEASSGADIRYRGDPAKSITHSSSGGSVKKSY